MKTKTLWILKFAFLAAVLLIAGCATQSAEVIPANPPGFWWGLLHGFILLFSFIASLFTEFRIYSFPNAGVLYDLGFLLGVLFFFGGGGAGSRR